MPLNKETKPKQTKVNRMQVVLHRLKATTRCHVTLGYGLAPDCSGLRGREKPEMYESHESRETRRNLDDLMS